jgi:diaminohydroxyphosphoribosylaminopyrimidine deaminase / 5-amino-6-(5-phosphoribosylamino)uracil reductase
MGKRPLRVIVDSRLRIPLSSRALDTRKFPTLVVTTREGLRNRTAIHAIREQGAEIVAVPARDGRCDLKALLAELGKRNIEQLLVEGGATLLDCFVRARQADAVCAYIAPKKLGTDGAAPLSESVRALADPARLREPQVRRFDGDECVEGLLRSTSD